MRPGAFLLGVVKVLAFRPVSPIASGWILSRRARSPRTSVLSGCSTKHDPPGTGHPILAGLTPKVHTVVNPRRGEQITLAMTLASDVSLPWWLQRSGVDSF